MSKETLFLVAPESWRVPAGMPRDCMLWEAYSKATVVLYMHKYNDIYLLYLYILIFKPKQWRSKRQWCQRQLPTALCPPAVEPAGMGARGCAFPTQPRVQLPCGAFGRAVCAPGVCSALAAGGTGGSPRGAIQRGSPFAVCSPLSHSCLSFPRGGKGRDRSVLYSGSSRCWWGPFPPRGSGILPCPPILRPP